MFLTLNDLCHVINSKVVLGELSLGLGSVHSVAGHGSELLAPVILIMDIVGDILEILHMGPEKK